MFDKISESFELDLDAGRNAGVNPDSFVKTIGCPYFNMVRNCWLLKNGNVNSIPSGQTTTGYSEDATRTSYFDGRRVAVAFLFPHEAQ